MDLPTLDASQAAVLALADGASASVLGAPGSGKTTTIVELVAARVRERGYGTDEVLVLAPSRATATALRDRLAVRVGLPAGGPLARTANSIAFQLVRRARGEVTLLTGAEQDRVIADLIEGGVEEGFGPLWPARLGEEVRRLRGFRTELRELIMRTAEHGVGVSELAALGRATGRPEWEAAAEFLGEYADAKDQAYADQFDAAELSAYAARIVRDAADPEGELGALSRLRLIVVDDAQEATESTIALLREFARRGVAVIAFGDPDVAGNGFRGGRADLVGALGRELGIDGVETIVLECVHRGRAGLRETAGRIVSHIGTALGGPQRRARLAAVEEPDELVPVVGIEAPSRPAELAHVARLLREHHLLHDVPWSEIAVVVRSGADVAGVERALAQADVPTRGQLARCALRDEPGARPLVRAAAVVLGRIELDAAAAAELLLGPIGGLDGVALRRLRLALRQSELGNGGLRTSDELLLDGFADPELFAAIDAAPARRATRLARLLVSARAIAEDGGSIEDILWSIWEASGLAAEWGTQAEDSGVLADEANRALDGAVALFAAAQRFVERTPTAPAGRFVDDMLASEVPEDSLAPHRSGDEVFVGTPPALIGRAFEVVVVAGLQSGAWPNLRPRGSLLHADAIPAAAAAHRAGEPIVAEVDAVSERRRVRDDELRLFALAATRATRQLVLSCTSNDDEQPSPLMSFAEEKASLRRDRPMHLRGLVGALRRELVVRSNPDAAAALAVLARERVPGADPASWYGLGAPTTSAPIVDLDAGELVRVSPSQIEKAENAPLGWFVDQMAAPPSGLAASIGTLVHTVVEAVASRDETGLDAIWAEVEARWGELRFDAPWIAERELARARRMAEGAAEYLESFADDGKLLLGQEGAFTVELGSVRLSGAIDRIERSEDGTVVIVDLKTGKTVPSITGMPDHPQLGAYQLAALAARAEDGADDGPFAGERFGGAKLVYLARPDRGRGYTERVQPAYGEESAEAFRDRVAQAGRIMSSARFAGPLDERGRYGSWEYRVHLVKAVSA